MKLTTQRAKKIKNTILILLWILTIYAAYSGIMFYKTMQDNPQKRYEVMSYQSLPDEALNKIEMHNSTLNWIYLGLLLVVIYYYFDYKSRPEDHWAGFFVKIAKKITKDIDWEDD